MLPPIGAIPFTPPISAPAPIAPSVPATPAGGAADSAGFWSQVKGAMDSMAQSQGTANLQVADLVNGNSQDIHTAAIAVEKSDLAFSLALQLRNKAVSAYQDISHMAF